jgi:Cu/Ag efflux pump CusA
LKPLTGEEGERVQAEVRAALLKFPGVYFAIKSFLTERIEETLAGAVGDVVVKVFGDDLATLDEKAHEVAGALERIVGARDVQVRSPPGTPRAVIHLRPERVATLGLRTLDVLEAVETAFQGTVVAQVHEGSRVADVIVILDEAARRDPEAPRDLPLHGPGGARVLLGEVAEIASGAGRSEVVHEGGRREQVITANVRGRDVASFAAEARKAIASVRFPAGTYAVFGGAAEAQAEARGELLLHSALAGSGIILLLFVVFGRLRNLLLVLANLPFALVGGVLAVFMTGGWLTMGSLVGFVTLFGITMRNSIMLISHFEHLVEKEGMAWGLEATLQGATERLVPILMTALVTALGLAPIALGSGEAGREIEGPMAIVILGGLASSTALNLLVLPVLALRYGRFAKEAAKDEGA